MRLGVGKRSLALVVAMLMILGVGAWTWPAVAEPAEPDPDGVSTLGAQSNLPNTDEPAIIVEPLKPEELAVNGSADEDPLLPDIDVPTAIPPVQGVFAVRVNTGAWVTWVAEVPLPVDYSGDLVVDGTFTLTADYASDRACLELTRNPLLGGASPTTIQFRYQSLDLSIQYDSMPASQELCAGRDGLWRTLSLNGGSSSGGVRFDLDMGNEAYDVEFDRVPSSMRFAWQATQAETLRVDHDASVTLEVVIGIVHKNIQGTIDRLPIRFDGELRFLPGTSVAQADLSYSASSGIAYTHWTWGQEWQDDYFTTTIHNLPSSLDFHFDMDRSSSNVDDFRIQQTASAPYGPVYVYVRADENPSAFSADQMPAWIFDARFEPRGGESGLTGFDILFNADGPVVDFRFEMGLLPNPFYYTDDYALVNVDELPRYIDGTLRFTGGSVASVAVDALLSSSAKRPTVLFHLFLNRGDFDVTGSLYDIPHSISLEYDVDGTSLAPGAPSFSYSGADSGFDLVVEVKGFKIAGRLYVYVDDLPRTFAAWLSAGSGDDVARMDLDTFGTGRLGEFFVNADLPIALNDMPFWKFQVDFKDLARLEVHFIDPLDCLFRACVEFRSIDSGDFWWWNAPPTIFGITTSLVYKMQQHESCWYGPCWNTKYHWDDWTNGFAYYADQYGMDGRDARAVGFLF